MTARVVPFPTRVDGRGRGSAAADAFAPPAEDFEPIPMAEAEIAALCHQYRDLIEGPLREKYLLDGPQ